LDDLALGADAVEKVLHRIGVHVVGIATACERALSMLDKHQPDIFVTELETNNGIDPIAFVQRALERAPHTKTIILSSHDLHVDIYNEVGANTADVKTISGITTAPGPNISGYIHINFTAVVGQPVISAIKLTPIRPAVTVKSPTAGATGVSRSTAVKATFSQSMDGATILPTTFTIAGPNGVPLAATVSYASNSKIATLNPSTALTANTTYTVTLDKSIKSLPGLQLGTPVTWQFTTGSK